MYFIGIRTIEFPKLRYRRHSYATGTPVRRAVICSCRHLALRENMLLQKPQILTHPTDRKNRRNRKNRLRGARRPSALRPQYFVLGRTALDHRDGFVGMEVRTRDEGTKTSLYWYNYCRTEGVQRLSLLLSGRGSVSRHRVYSESYDNCCRSRKVSQPTDFLEQGEVARVKEMGHAFSVVHRQCIRKA